MPNKLEKYLVMAILFLATWFTALVFPLIVDIEKYNLATKVTLFMIVYFLVTLFVQSIFNILYVMWQRKR